MLLLLSCLVMLSEAAIFGCGGGGGEGGLSEDVEYFESCRGVSR